MSKNAGTKVHLGGRQYTPPVGQLTFAGQDVWVIQIVTCILDVKIEHIEYCANGDAVVDVSGIVPDKQQEFLDAINTWPEIISAVHLVK